MTFHYYLDKPKATVETSLYLFLRQGQQKIKYNTGIKVFPKDWDLDKESIKRSDPRSSELNLLLSSYKTEVQKALSRLQLKNSSLTFEEVKEEVISFFENRKPKDTKKDFFKIYDEFLAVKDSVLRLNTMKKHRTTLSHLKSFVTDKKYPLSFETIDHKFHEQFLSYLLKEGLTNNTSNKYVAVMKVFLNWAEERGYHDKQTFRKFKTPSKKAEIVVLTQQELKTLFELDLTKNKTLAKVRDTFCFGCYTGQRYSDIAALKREHIKGKTWHLHTVKTSDAIEVPLIDNALAILKKYESEEYVLPVISNQKTNSYIKELCKLAGIKESITHTRYKGAERITNTQPKHEFITTHTARRTFVTLSLEKGMRPEMVMEVTGHKDYNTFRKYIKLTSKVKDNEMRRIWESS